MTIVPCWARGDGFPYHYGWISPSLAKRHSLTNTEVISTASAIICVRQTARFPVPPWYLCCYNPVLPWRSSILIFTLLAIWKPKGRMRPLVIHSRFPSVQFSIVGTGLPRGMVPSVDWSSAANLQQIVFTSTKLTQSLINAISTDE